jgi:2-methylfumaryl-CoA isomerase
MDVDLDTEAGRYEARDAIAALLGRWCARHTLEEIRKAFSGTSVLWGHFQDFLQLIRDDPRCSEQNPLFAAVDQPGIGRYLMPGLPLDFSGAQRTAAPPAPLLGQHTREVLAELGVDDGATRRHLLESEAFRALLERPELAEAA